MCRVPLCRSGFRLAAVAAHQVGVPAASAISSSCVPRSTTWPLSSTTIWSASAHSGQPVRDRDRRAARGQRVDGLLHRLLGTRVQRARRLVEHQDRRIAQDRPRDRQPLLLPAGEPVAALPDDRVVAVRQPDDVVVDAAPPARRASSSSPVASGLANRRFSATEAWNRYVSCETTPTASASVAKLSAADVHAVDRDGRRAHVVQPREQVARASSCPSRFPRRSPVPVPAGTAMSTCDSVGSRRSRRSRRRSARRRATSPASPARSGSSMSTTGRGTRRSGRTATATSARRPRSQQRDGRPEQRHLQRGERDDGADRTSRG